MAKTHQQGTPVIPVERNAFVALTSAHRAYVIETESIVLWVLPCELLKNEELKKANLGG